MDCKHVKNELLAKIKGEVSPEVMNDIQNHLRNCAACRMEEERIMKTLTAVHTVEDYRPSDESWLRLETAIQCLVRQQEEKRAREDGVESGAGSGRASRLLVVTAVVSILIAASVLLYTFLNKAELIGNVTKTKGDMVILREHGKITEHNPNLPAAIRVGDSILVGSSENAMADIKFEGEDLVSFNKPASDVHFTGKKQLLIVAGGGAFNLSSTDKYTINFTKGASIETAGSIFKTWLDDKGTIYLKVDKGSVSLHSVNKGKSLQCDDPEQLYIIDPDTGDPAIITPKLRLVAETEKPRIVLGPEGFHLKMTYTLFNDGNRAITINSQQTGTQLFSTQIISEQDASRSVMVSLALEREITPRNPRTGQVTLKPGDFYKIEMTGTIKLTNPGAYLVKGFYQDDQVLPDKTLECVKPVRIEVVASEKSKEPILDKIR